MLEISQPPLAQLTTLRLGGPARVLLAPENMDDVFLLQDRAKMLGAPLYPLGRGSNLLCADEGVNLVLVKLEAFQDIRVCGRDGDKVFVRAEAGVPLKRLLRFCLTNSLAGMEGLAGIPGEVGGACAMNAGSFGVEIGALVHTLEIFADGKKSLCPASGAKPEYRKLTLRNYSTFPLVLAATFALTASLKKDIFQRMNLNYLEKKSRQPLDVWSAGCAFKNPPGGISAGRLLEQAGFRGRRMGGMYFSKKHANFLVNGGTGTAAQAFELMECAREAVSRMSGITLESEIRVLS